MARVAGGRRAGPRAHVQLERGLRVVSLGRNQVGAALARGHQVVVGLLRLPRQPEVVVGLLLGGFLVLLVDVLVQGGVLIGYYVGDGERGGVLVGITLDRILLFAHCCRHL